MTAALRLPETPSFAEIIEALRAADVRHDDLLRQAVGYAVDIAPLVIELVDRAANAEELTEPELNLLFWGIHILAAGRCKDLYQPLIRLFRARGDEVHDVLGDAATDTLPKIVISVFDGDPAPLIEACADRTVNDYARWELVCALSRLTFDGAVPRETTLTFLDRFEREPLADPHDEAWQGWQDAICLLGIEEMRERLIAASREGRFPQDDIELEYCLEQLTVASSLAPGDPALFVRTGLVPIDDPVAALHWVRDTDNETDNLDEDDEFVGPDPGAEFALNDEEIGWLRHLIASKAAEPDVMSLEMIDGFYCALSMDNDTRRVGEFAAAVFGEFAPKTFFESDEQEERAARLLTRHLRTIVARLDTGYAHTPLLEPTAAPKGQFWAKGFVQGMQVALDDWAGYLQNDELLAFAAPMLTLMLDDHEERDGVLMTPEKRADCIPLLPHLLVALHACVRLEQVGKRKTRKTEPYETLPVRTTPKIGRNAPCPCGSGKKYKRCCGSPTNSIN